MKRQIQVIQIMRLFSAIVVLLSHLFVTGEYELPNQVGFAGRLGVAFFFMISGFLLVYTDRGIIKGYFRKRIVRLIPLYWIMTGFVFMIGLVMPSFLHTSSPDISNLIKSFFFIPFYISENKIFPLYPIGWTLTAEVFVYIIYFIPLILLKIPVIARIFDKKEIYFKSFLTSCILIGLVILRHIVPQNVFTDAYGADYMLYFVTGILASCFWKKIPEKTFPAQKSFSGTVSALCIGIFIIFISVFYRESYLSIFLIGLAFVILLWAFWNFEFPKAFVRCGDISYSFYLIHYFVVKGITRILIHTQEASNILLAIVLFLICFAVTVILSLISYELIEIRFSKCLKKLLRLN